jgi:hypothetical protein
LLAKTILASTSFLPHLRKAKGLSPIIAAGRVKKKFFCDEMQTLIFLSFQTVIDDKNNIMNYIITKVNTNLH